MVFQALQGQQTIIHALSVLVLALVLKVPILSPAATQLNQLTVLKVFPTSQSLDVEAVLISSSLSQASSQAKLLPVFLVFHLVRFLVLLLLKCFAEAPELQQA